MRLRWLLVLATVALASCTETTTMMDEMEPTTMVPEATTMEMDVDEPQPEPEESSTMAMDKVDEGRGHSDTGDLLKKIYSECIQKGSFSCIKPKLLSFLSSAAKKDNIQITEVLSIVKNGKASFAGMQETPAYLTASLPRDEEERREAVRLLVLDEVEKFLASHDLKVRIPKEIVSGEMLPFVPKFLLDNIPSEINVPLSDQSHVQERSFVKKVVIPFLLGLKFKATALIPLALAFIALKTWKALTLGLLSLVLSGAMLILKSTKPKVVSYEVVHYPQHPHSYDHVSYDRGGYDYGRTLSEQPLAYRAYPRL